MNFFTKTTLIVLIATSTANSMQLKRHPQLELGPLRLETHFDRGSWYNPYNNGRTRLHNAACNGRGEIVAQLLAAGADVNWGDYNGTTSLAMVAYSGDYAMVKQLIRADADVNLANDKGETPLYWASFKGHNAVVTELLAVKANVNLADKNGETPLMRATFWNHKSTCEMLVKWMVQQHIPSEIQKNRWYTFLACLRNNPDDTIRAAYTTCILDVLKKYLHANILAENNAKPEESVAYQEINKIQDSENIKQQLLEYVGKC